MNDEMFRQSLIEVMNHNLLNDFVNHIFNYDLEENQYVYIQYKIVNSNIVLNIFDNSNDNRFKAIIFTESDIASDENINYVNVNGCYWKYCNGECNDDLLLLGALLKTEKKEEKIDIINCLFDGEMKDIFIKNFTL